MGTTLENGVYLPSEGERNCYAGLKTNWEILDQKVADVTALQQAVAGALHREIVASLPTTDINPNTIYMILSGTSATENVYDEYMYVNNAWELIGTSATDLTNYYTKAEVDGKLLLKANASDLTSHTGDTTIHVTASDKTKWTNSANTHVLRLALSALTPSTSDNSFSNLDDATALKVGDKVMDTAGVLFEVTAIDTQNSTFTIGTALVDLANDSDVVHKSGSETIAGVKTFANNTMVVGRATDSISAIQFINSDVVGDSANGSSGFEVYGSSISDDNKIGGLTVGEYSNNGGSFARIICHRTVSGVKSSNEIRSLIRPNGSKELSATVDNDCKLGTEFLRWSKIYGTEYYYGSNNVEFSTKFVTTDTNQTIGGTKDFSDVLRIYNSNASSNTAQLWLKNSKVNRGQAVYGDQAVWFRDAIDKPVMALVSRVTSTGASAFLIQVYNIDQDNQQVSNYLSFVKNLDGTCYLLPDQNDVIELGSSPAKFKSVNTNKINGVEPSSLSLPSYTSNRIDISSYITNLTGGSNNYTAPANGYIFVRTTNGTYVKLTEYPSGVCSSVCSQTADDIGTFLPVNANRICIIAIKCSSIDRAYFIPCQGNV